MCLEYITRKFNWTERTPTRIAYKVMEVRRVLPAMENKPQLEYSSWPRRVVMDINGTITDRDGTITPTEGGFKGIRWMSIHNEKYECGYHSFCNKDDAFSLIGDADWANMAIFKVRLSHLAAEGKQEFCNVYEEAFWGDVIVAKKMEWIERVHPRLGVLCGEQEPADQLTLV